MSSIYKVLVSMLSVQLNSIFGKLLRSLGRCAELLLLHFSSFIIGRRLEVTVGSEEENLLLPSAVYCPNDDQPFSPKTSHVVTVSAPKDAPRYQNNLLPCCSGKSSELLKC